MKKNIYMTTVLLLSAAWASAQSLLWNGKFGGDGEDVVLAMHTDASGNTYTTGYFTNSCDFDITSGEYFLNTNPEFECFVQKTDPNGNLLWAKAMGGEAGDYGTKITTDAAGNVYLTGVFQLTADFDPSDGEYLLTATGSLDIFILKLDPDGNFVWARHFEGTEYEESNGIGVDTAGNLYVSGYFYNELDFDPSDGEYFLTPGFGDGFLAKLTTDGDFQWAQKFGGPDFELATGMKTMPNGEVYISGNFEGTVDFDPTDEEAILTADPGTGGIYLYHVNSDGGLIKAIKIAQVANGGYGLSIDVDSQGSAYVTGYLGGNGIFYTTGSETLMPLTEYINGYVVKVAADGSVAWAKHLKSTMVSNGYAVAANANNEVFISGYFNGTLQFDGIELTESSDGDTESYAAKLSTDGNFMWAVQYGGINTVDRSAMSLDADGNILLASAFEVTADINPEPTGITTVETSGFRDSFLIKLADEVLSVPEHAANNSITVYPNPAKDKLYITADASMEGKNYILYDIAGRQVLQGQLATGQAIDLGALQAGLYHLSLEGKTSKIIKE